MKTSKKIIFAIILTLLVFVFLEIASDVYCFFNRLYIQYRISQQEIMNAKMKERYESVLRQIQWRNSEYLRGYFLPSQTMKRIGNTVVNIDELGFRKTPTSSYKTNGILIACIGDSVTFGWSCSSDYQTYPSQLAEIMTDRNVQVINASMPRFNSMDLLDLYIGKIISLSPDYVVILIGWNDLAYQMTQPPPEGEKYEIPASKMKLLLDAFTNTSSLGQVLRKVSDMLRTMIVDKKKITSAEMKIIQDAEDRKGEIDWDSFDVFENILRSFVTLSRANGSVPVLVTLPHFMKEDLSLQEKRTLIPHLTGWPSLSYDDWQKMIQEANTRIRKVAKEKQVALAECYDQVASKHFVDICHLNDDGNKVLAQCIANNVAVLIEESSKLQQKSSPRVNPK